MDDNQANRVRTSLNLHQLISKLENPDVRLPDNTDYRLDVQTLGILYACAVSKVNGASSPGIVLAEQRSLSPDVVVGYKKNFQRWSRNFFYQRLGEMGWRKYTREKLAQQFLPQEFPVNIAPNTIESWVKELTQKGQFSTIGQCLKAGAVEYNKKVQEREMPNYRFAAEYNAILRALQK